jgi:hypothetical protein
VEHLFDEISTFVSDCMPGPDPVEEKRREDLAGIGSRLAAEHGYTGLDGMRGLHRYLVDRYHWHPDDVRGLSLDDLELLVAGVAPAKQPPAKQPTAEQPTAKQGKKPPRTSARKPRE